MVSHVQLTTTPPTTPDLIVAMSLAVIYGDLIIAMIRVVEFSSDLWKFD